MLSQLNRLQRGHRSVCGLALALALAGCERPAPPVNEPVATAPEPAVTAAAAPAAPTETVKAFLTDYLGEVTITVKPGTVLPVAHRTQPQQAFDCAWPAGQQPAGSATIEVDQGRGYVSLAILRWPQAKPGNVTDEELSATALARLQQWTGAAVDVERVAVQPLGDESRVAFVWDGGAGDQYSGQRAHIVLARGNGLPVSFVQYQPPTTSIAPTLTEAQGVAAGIAALPEGFQQTAVDARLYAHSPLSKDDGPVWAVALTGTTSEDDQEVHAGAVIDAVSGEVLAPQPDAADPTES